MNHAGGDVRDCFRACPAHLAGVLEGGRQGAGYRIDHRFGDVTRALDGRDDSALYGLDNTRFLLAHDRTPFELVCNVTLALNDGRGFGHGPSSGHDLLKSYSAGCGWVGWSTTGGSGAVYHQLC